MTLNDLGLSTNPNPNETLCPGESEKAREERRLRLSTDPNRNETLCPSESEKAREEERLHLSTDPNPVSWRE